MLNEVRIEARKEIMADKVDLNRLIVLIFTTVPLAAISPFLLFGISLFEVSTRIILIGLAMGILYTLRDMLTQWKRMAPLKEITEAPRA